MAAKKSEGRSVCITWKWEEALDWQGSTPEGGNGKHSGGLEPGTTAFIWATKGGELYLMGAIRVESSNSHQMRGKSIHGLFRLIPLKEKKWRLRFTGSKDRLRKDAKGTEFTRQIRARRWITAQSSELLDRLLRESGQKEHDIGQSIRVWEHKYAETMSLARVSSPALRDMALASHGAVCDVCKMDFGKRYGPFARYCVEVHHLIPRSKTKSGVLTGMKDVVILCPNCHSAFHRWPENSSYSKFKKRVITLMKLR